MTISGAAAVVVRSNAGKWWQSVSRARATATLAARATPSPAPDRLSPLDRATDGNVATVAAARSRWHCRARTIMYFTAVCRLASSVRGRASGRGPSGPRPTPECQVQLPTVFNTRSFITIILCEYTYRFVICRRRWCVLTSLNTANIQLVFKRNFCLQK